MVNAEQRLEWERTDGILGTGKPFVLSPKRASVNTQSLPKHHLPDGTEVRELSSPYSKQTQSPRVEPVQLSLEVLQFSSSRRLPHCPLVTRATDLSNVSGHQGRGSLLTGWLGGIFDIAICVLLL